MNIVLPTPPEAMGQSFRSSRSTQVDLGGSIPIEKCHFPDEALVQRIDAPYPYFFLNNSQRLCSS